MARSIYSEKLRNRTNRLRLTPKRKPYKTLISPGVFLAYRRNAGRVVEGDDSKRRDTPGTWSVEAGWLKRFALADDHEEANGVSVMSYHQAMQRALKLARGSEGDTDKPVTVAEALDAYETDLAARGGSKHNAISVRNHCSPAMLSKVVMLLTETELRDWRNGLIAKGLKLSSANRIGKSFKAALALAAKRDRKRITNSAAWRDGLKPLKGKGSNKPPRDNYYLPDATILVVVRECYVEREDFGALIETLAGTGTRESQVLKLWPDDVLEDHPDGPQLMMWCSAKGRDRDPEQRMVEIPPQLRTRCRNPKCTDRLKIPADNPRDAFCCRLCEHAFYGCRCRVCEQLLTPKTARRQVCWRSKCRHELQRHPEQFFGGRHPSSPVGHNAEKSSTKSTLKTGTKSGRGSRMAVDSEAQLFQHGTPRPTSSAATDFPAHR